MKKTKKIFALILCLVLLVCSVPMVISAETPELNTTYNLGKTLNYQMTDTAYSNSYSTIKNLGETVDFSMYDYIEFDAYVVWTDDSTTSTSLRIFGLNAGQMIYGDTTAVEVGKWVHVVMPISNFKSLGGSTSAVSQLMIEKTGISTISVANTALTNFAPEMKNTYNTVKELDYKYTELVYNNNPYNTRKTFGEIVNLNDYDYLEFDVYLTSETLDEIALRMYFFDSSVKSGFYDFTAIETDKWVHMVMPAAAFNTGFGLNGDKTDAKYFMLERSGITTVSVANTALTNFAPEMQNTYNTVKELDYKCTELVYNNNPYNTRKTFGEIVNLNDYDYLEFDVYLTSETLDEIALRMYFFDSSLKSGFYDFTAIETDKWVHMVMPAAAFNTGYGLNGDKTDAKYFMFERSGITTISVANVALTNFAPEMNNKYDFVEHINYKLTSVSYNNNPYTTQKSLGDTSINLNNYDYIEFDVYLTSETADSINLRMHFLDTKNGRGFYDFSDVKTEEWVHLNLPASSFNTSSGMNGDKSDARYFMFERSGIDKISVANMAFTSFAPDINETLMYKQDIVWKNEGLFWQVTVDNGTRLPVSAANYFPYINNGETVDATGAGFVEVDVYSSEDIVSGGSLWLSRNTWAGSGRARGNFLALKKGWNHLALDLSKFSAAGGEFTEGYPYDPSILLTMFIEFTADAIDENATTIEFAMANLAFTNASAKLDNVYANEMIFQRNKPIHVTGWGLVDTTIRVDIKNASGEVVRTGTTVVADDETWKISLDAMEGGYDEYELSLYADDDIHRTINGIRIGEVFVASGQSNMDLHMWETYEGAQMYYNKSFDLGNVSFYNAGNVGLSGAEVPYEPDRNSMVGSWCRGDSNAEGVSAVAYYFAENIQKKLDVPVGIMQVAMGGSSIFAWISREYIEADEVLMKYLTGAKIYYDESNWDESYAQKKMTSLYNTEVAAVAGLEISGVIWYQGCDQVGISDGVYTRALGVLRDCYAETFNYTEETMPFMFVQLAPYAYGGQDLPKMWAQMTEAAKIYEKMGTVTIYDLPLDWYYGDWAPWGWGGDVIHPTTKKPVGNRLAECMYALKYESSYGEYSAPIWTGEIRTEGKYAYLDFVNVGDGLATPNGITLDGFAVADILGVYVNAKAEIVDKNTVRVWADTIENPVAVSYSYDNYCVTSNLYSTQHGDVFLPAAPFISERTDVAYHDNMSWLTVDDAKVLHIDNSSFDFAYYDAWSANGATAEIVSDIKDYGDGALKLTYSADNASFTASPTLVGAEGALFRDVSYGYYFYDRIDFKLKNVGSAINIDRIAFYADGVWYYAEINKELPADSGWVTVSADLNSLVDENGNKYTDSLKLKNVTEIQWQFSGVTGDGAVYLDTIEFGNETYNRHKINPELLKTFSVTELGFNVANHWALNTAYLQDTTVMYNDGAVSFGCDYIEFDIYINDIEEFNRVKELDYNFRLWIGSDSENRYEKRCYYDIGDLVIKTGWNHIVIDVDDITYKETGFSFENMKVAYITCLKEGGLRDDMRLSLKIANFIQTIHAGDLTADGEVNMLDLIRMKKVLLEEDVEYDKLAFDTTRNGKDEISDFTALKKFIFSYL